MSRLPFVLVASGGMTGGTAVDSTHPRDARTRDPHTAHVAEPGVLGSRERRQLDVVRRFGTVGALLMAAGALGAGAAPVDNPLSGLRLLGLFSRIPTVAMACAWVGMGMVVLAWLWLGQFAVPGRRRMVSRTQLDRTVVMWALPLALAPPMFSRDVYPYLAQSEVAARGLDPYELGPSGALGFADPFTANTPNIWRDTPAPYGPLFLTIGRPVVAIAGDNVLVGALLWRLLTLIGIALIVWALPRLAHRCNVHPSSALWLGVANPLVLFHLVSGAHNEAIGVGLMLAGFEIALRRRGLVPIITGAAMITAAGGIKPPALVALGFLGVALARRRGSRFRDLVNMGVLMLTVLLVVMAIIVIGSGLGMGWVSTMDVPNLIRSWMAPMTGLGMLAGAIGIALGLGSHTEKLLALTQDLGYGLAAVLLVYLLWTCFKGRLSPQAGMGIGFGGVILLGPVLHPWYLLWMAIPLAAATNDSRFRTTATAISAAIAVLVPPTGNGFDFRSFVIPQAVAAAAVALAIVLFLVRGKIPPLLPSRRSRSSPENPSPGAEADRVTA